jgi:Activator of Hsp90 ATPase homolog 1-like protein.
MKNYTILLTVDVSAHDVFNRINNVAAWWTDDLKGNSEKLNDVFTVQFADMHVSTQKLIEVIPDKKIVWLVTDSNLSFIKDKNEWTNTTIIFDISRHSNQTHIKFTHVGLLPDIECYKDCTKGWEYYIKRSLFKLLTEGEGTPGL